MISVPAVRPEDHLGHLRLDAKDHELVSLQPLLKAATDRVVFAPRSPTGASPWYATHCPGRSAQSRGRSRSNDRKACCPRSACSFTVMAFSNSSPPTALGIGPRRIHYTRKYALVSSQWYVVRCIMPNDGSCQIDLWQYLRSGNCHSGAGPSHRPGQRRGTGMMLGVSSSLFHHAWRVAWRRRNERRLSGPCTRRVCIGLTDDRPHLSPRHTRAIQERAFCCRGTDADRDEHEPRQVGCGRRRPV